jgi:diaminopimelate epimerase
MSLGEAMLALGKYEGAGNDFLVLLDPPAEGPLRADEVVALCHRRRGVGADGLLELRPGSAGSDLGMVLWNADGSQAEMSGNGVRCLVHAALDAGRVGPGAVRVATAAGLRTVEVRGTDAPGTAEAEVAMGPVELGPGWVRAGDRWEELPPVAGAPAGAPRLEDGAVAALQAMLTEAVPGPRLWVRLAGAGNPHVVVVVGQARDREELEALAARLGPPVGRLVPGGANLEVGVLKGPGRARMAVFERGVGLTQACGTGSVAFGAVVAASGLSPAPLDVANPGGVLRVALGSDGVRLGGPSRRVAEVRVARAWLWRPQRP